MPRPVDNDDAGISCQPEGGVGFSALIESQRKRDVTPEPEIPQPIRCVST